MQQGERSGLTSYFGIDDHKRRKSAAHGEFSEYPRAQSCTMRSQAADEKAKDANQFRLLAERLERRSWTAHSMVLVSVEKLNGGAEQVGSLPSPTPRRSVRTGLFLHGSSHGRFALPGTLSELAGLTRFRSWMRFRVAHPAAFSPRSGNRLQRIAGGAYESDTGTVEVAEKGSLPRVCAALPRRRTSTKTRSTLLKVSDPTRFEVQFQPNPDGHALSGYPSCVTACKRH